MPWLHGTCHWPSLYTHGRRWAHHYRNMSVVPTVRRSVGACCGFLLLFLFLSCSSQCTEDQTHVACGICEDALTFFFFLRSTKMKMHFLHAYAISHDRNVLYALVSVKAQPRPARRGTFRLRRARFFFVCLFVFATVCDIQVTH